ncbi:FkbM family methyltransferase [Paraglaciecola sp. 2405UD69-4]|uniref:FkbM family methyltransferase n=1 Tax=Paraglaciecola sp. 2405UD69-4 TaxID=3391836 RepID=UPI0039C94961
MNEFLPFCEVLNQLNRSFTFFDLGADIGVVSSLIASHCPKVHNFIAFEPNPHSFETLRANLEQINKSVVCINAAVSNFDGSAKFHFNHKRANDHEGYIDEKAKGSTEVLTLDTWHSKQTNCCLEGTLVFKIDVEGQELAAFEGASSLILNAESCIVLLEIHPEVLDRVGQTPEDLFTSAEKLASFKWYVPELGNLPVIRSIPFYTQFELKQYDVIGISQSGDV